jgi:hypothetical protein
MPFAKKLLQVVSTAVALCCASAQFQTCTSANNQFRAAACCGNAQGTLPRTESESNILGYLLSAYAVPLVFPGAPIEISQLFAYLGTGKQYLDGPYVEIAQGCVNDIFKPGGARSQIMQAFDDDFQEQFEQQFVNDTLAALFKQTPGLEIGVAAVQLLSGVTDRDEYAHFFNGFETADPGWCIPSLIAPFLGLQAMVDEDAPERCFDLSDVASNMSAIGRLSFSDSFPDGFEQACAKWIPAVDKSKAEARLRAFDEGINFFIQIPVTLTSSFGAGGQCILDGEYSEEPVACIPSVLLPFVPILSTDPTRDATTYPERVCVDRKPLHASLPAYEDGEKSCYFAEDGVSRISENQKSQLLDNYLAGQAFWFSIPSGILKSLGDGFSCLYDAIGGEILKILAQNWGQGIFELGMNGGLDFYLARIVYDLTSILDWPSDKLRTSVKSLCDPDNVARLGPLEISLSLDNSTWPSSQKYPSAWGRYYRNAVCNLNKGKSDDEIFYVFGSRNFPYSTYAGLLLGQVLQNGPLSLVTAPYALPIAQTFRSGAIETLATAFVRETLSALARWPAAADSALAQQTLAAVNGQIVSGSISAAIFVSLPAVADGLLASGGPGWRDH